MKKLKCKIAAIFLMMTGLIGCASNKVVGSGYQGNSAKVQKNKVNIIDYQGSSFGSEIPQWVIEIGNGNYSTDTFVPLMSGVKGKKLFVTIARGTNLDFVMNWSDLVDIEVQVGDEMQRIVGKAVSAVQKASTVQEGDGTTEEKYERQLLMYKQAVSAVELNGLEKIASYWIQKEVHGNGSKDTKVYYEYYAVWGMNETYYNSQIKSAMNSISDNSDEGKALKAALSKKLQDMLVTSNDETVNEDAEESL